MRKLVVLMFIVALTGLSFSEEVVIGNWEQQDDGWVFPGSWFYEDTIGVTRDNYSLGGLADGWEQSFSIALQNNGLVDEFMANTHFAIDVSAGPATAGGWVELYSVSANVEGSAWTDLGDGNPLWHQDRWDGAPEVTETIVLDYSILKPLLTPGYAEFIIAINGDGGHNIYFDNARLIPEPMTIALLGLGGLFLRRRK